MIENLFQYKTFVVEKDELPQEVDWPNNSQNVTVEISACEESFQIVLDDLSSSIDPNLDKQDRSLRQFYELITSQAAFNK